MAPTPAPLPGWMPSPAGRRLTAPVKPHRLKRASAQSLSGVGADAAAGVGGAGGPPARPGVYYSNNEAGEDLRGKSITSTSAFSSTAVDEAQEPGVQEQHARYHLGAHRLELVALPTSRT
jgi:hypothetical protein